MAAILGWVQRRWNEALEPVVSHATVEHEAELRAVWERELEWWKTQRGLAGDSLRKPITQVRALIKGLPLTKLNSWENPRTGEREHLGLKVFNLSEGEWVAMNARNQGVTQERLSQQVLLKDPDGLVQRAMSLLFSPEWADLVVGIAVCTGRRLAEIMKTGVFEVKTPYTLWFEGQVKGRGREQERYEIPTLVRAFLVVDAVQRLRALVDCTDLEIEQVSQKYGKAVNEAVARSYGDLEELIRATREKVSVHNFRGMYARIACFWYAPPSVADITYMAEIQGHRFIVEPRVEADTSPEEVEQIRHHYASHANYADYKIADTDGNIDGRQGVRLEQPGVTVLEKFRTEYEAWRAKVRPELESPVVVVRKGRKKAPREHKSRYSSFKPTIDTRAWGDDLREGMQRRLRREVKDDELLRRTFAAYERQTVMAGGPGGSVQRHASVGSGTLSLEQLNLSAETQAMLREGMAHTGAADLLSYLLAAGEREARNLRTQARRHDRERYAAMPTSKLAGMKEPGAGTERYRRAVYTLMQWNETHRALERWYVTTLAIQKLVGGRKEAINAYLETHQDEIKAHHETLEIKPSYNRKPEPITAMITIAEEPTAFPWGRPEGMSGGMPVEG
jgi:Telomere resolvase